MLEDKRKKRRTKKAKSMSITVIGGGLKARKVRSKLAAKKTINARIKKILSKPGTRTIKIRVKKVV